MTGPIEPSLPAPAAASADANIHRRLQTGYYVLEGLVSLGTSYYFNYLFFYMREHFGFGNRDNLLITALYGLTYMCASWYAGRFGQRRGYFFTLRLGFIGMALMMAFGGLAPLIFGYSRTTMILEWVIVALWVPSMCLIWPTLQAMLSREQLSGEGSRTAGIYNMVWAGTAALAYLTSGALLAAFGAETLFWLPAGIHLLALFLLPRLEKLAATSSPVEIPQHIDVKELPPLNPRPIARAKMFLRLARVANPFAYVGIYGIIPLIPKLSEHFGLTPAYAGLVCSVWFWTRLAGFAWFWRWPGWHYRFDWLAGAYLGLAGSFVAMLLTTHLWLLIVAQVIFGLAVSLIYYSSLFYAMDVGESKGNRGGFHEAAIGLGVFIGPVAGVSALRLFPQQPNAGIWGISALLVAGLAIFLCVRGRGWK